MSWQIVETEIVGGQTRAFFWCDTSGCAFGPMMVDREAAEEVARRAGGDPRAVSLDALDHLYAGLIDEREYDPDPALQPGEGGDGEFTRRMLREILRASRQHEPITLGTGHEEAIQDAIRRFRPDRPSTEGLDPETREALDWAIEQAEDRAQYLSPDPDVDEVVQRLQARAEILRRLQAPDRRGREDE